MMLLVALLPLFTSCVLASELSKLQRLLSLAGQHCSKTTYVPTSRRGILGKIF